MRSSSCCSLFVFNAAVVSSTEAFTSLFCCIATNKHLSDACCYLIFISVLERQSLFPFQGEEQLRFQPISVPPATPQQRMTYLFPPQRAPQLCLLFHITHYCDPQHQRKDKEYSDVLIQPAGLTYHY